MKEKLIGLTLVIIACLFWSISFSVSKLLLKILSPFELAFIRFFLASIFSLIVFFPKIRKASLSWNYQKPLFIAGLLGVTLYFIFENSGLKFTDASEGALIVGSFPALGLLVEYLFHREKLPLNRILGVLLSILGVFLIMSDSGLNLKFNNLFGDFLILLSGISWVIYNWEIKRVNQNYPHEVITTFQMIWGSILFIPFLFSTGLKIPKTLDAFIGIFFLAFFCSGLGYLFYNHGLKILSVSQVVNILNLIPLFGAIWGVIYLNESLTFIKIIGGVLIILGVSISSSK
ncbi:MULTISPECIES: DMT family transporter [Dictyoglomus]|uniref:EamA domain-containing protein n=1 Tax=Dictyoglomus turgidum (strain DSM 6724 / Z-1310) TaxID=515635 RepID=B8DZJ6_DICTD|nr:MULTISPECIES: DMT family transporter [Dictyoglomus]ACK41929.1 protein of unknown function DUF6 transmembrane [Dictyoglomus turgidum DSM 6724]HBU31511.1 EamA/RhaT family transporter [Dictyoglomus sp.]